MKRFLFFAFLLFLAACSRKASLDEGCPPITIPRETYRQYQSNERFDEFQINLVGFESYCYTDPNNNRRYADITPLFKVRRLEDSSTTRLDVRFFVRSSVNAEDYLGLRFYHQGLTIPLNSKEELVKGQTVKTRVSEPPYNGFSLELGMYLSENASDKAKGMFDIDYRYFSPAEIKAQNDKTITNEYLEINPDEEVIYSPREGRPIVVKKNRRQRGCLESNCQN